MGYSSRFYYADDEIVVAASERPVIQTAFNLSCDQVKELNPGEALLISKAGNVRGVQILRQKREWLVLWTNIFFSWEVDSEIYKERKALGENVTPAILKSIDNDLKNTVFFFYS